MISGISYIWRLFATALCFSLFGVAALIYGVLVFPPMRLIPGPPGAHRRRVRAVFKFMLRFFVELMRGLGVISYRFEGAALLGRPGQMILGNHPSLIDVVFLIAFTPQATCIVKQSLWSNPFTGWPVGDAGYVSNAPTIAMLERASRALREGQSVIIFPEGTRTRPGQALQFHRGAATIAVRAATVVTPVFIRVEPTVLAKNMPWYRVPHRRPRFTLRVGRDIDPEPFRNGPPSLASRAFNDHLLQVFADELSTGGRPDAPGRH